MNEKLDQMIEKLEIINLNLLCDNEKDFNRSLEMLLKSKNIKIKGVKAVENIIKRERTFPFKCGEIKVKSNKIYSISNNSIINLSIIKTFIDKIPQSFEIENIKILGGK